MKASNRSNPFETAAARSGLAAFGGRVADGGRLGRDPSGGGDDGHCYRALRPYPAVAGEGDRFMDRE